MFYFIHRDLIWISIHDFITVTRVGMGNLTLLTLILGE